MSAKSAKSALPCSVRFELTHQLVMAHEAQDNGDDLSTAAEGAWENGHLDASERYDAQAERAYTDAEYFMSAALRIDADRAGFGIPSVFAGGTRWQP